MNKWQNDILSALEQKGTFKMDYWNNELNADKEGFVFMQSVAQSQPAYSYLDSLGLVNRGFCPITGEKIEKGWKYVSNGRKIYLSERANEMGAKRKEEFLKKLKEENPNFETDLKRAKAFVEKANPYYKRPKFDNITFFGSLLLSGYLSYKLVRPESIFGYVGVVIVFILSFSIADWLRKKI
jgi:hypothetical protein